MEEKKVNIPDISCGHCVATIERELSELEGVTSVEGDPASKDVHVKWESPATWETIAATLEEIGYPARE